MRTCRTYVAALILGLWVYMGNPSEALAETPLEQAQAWVDKGLAMGDNSEREAQCYRQAVAIDPTYAAAHFNLGFVLQKQKRFDEAMEAYQSSLRHDPARAEAYYNLATILKLVRQDAALTQVRALVNRYVELKEDAAEAGRHDPGQADAETLGEAREEIQQIERTLAARKNARFQAEYTAREIADRLASGFRRGESPYTGPRIPMQIQFAFDSARILPGSEPQLQQVAEALRDPRLRGMTVMVEGHTDSTGPWAYNLDLAVRRAGAVKHLLASRFRVPEERIRTRGFGEDRPLAPNDSEENQARNRRVEFLNWDKWQALVTEVRSSRTRSARDELVLQEDQCLEAGRPAPCPGEWSSKESGLR